MGYVLDSQKTKTELDSVAKQATSQRKSSYSGSLTRIPLWATYAYGNSVPPALRLAGDPLPGKLEPTSAAPTAPTMTNKTGLPTALKAGVETLSGISMDDVAVHYNSPQPAQLQALAHTQGTNIHLRSGQEQHLAHELWHVVQQKQGRVQPTTQLRGAAINDETALEQEADVMGGRATAIESNAHTVPASLQSSAPSHQVLQAVWEKHPEADLWLWKPLLDGVTWFANAQGLMWYDITDPTEIKIGSYTAYKYWEKKLFTYNQWQGIAQQAQQAQNLPPQPLITQQTQQPLPQSVITQQATDPISIIKATDLTNLKPIILQNSRAKRLYLFDAHGQPTTDKAQAVYMVDTAMNKTEYDNYHIVAQWGVRVPYIYGVTASGHPIVQWLKKQITVGGGGRSLVTQVSKSMQLDELNRKAFDTAKWQRTLQDVNFLINLKYTSPDFQFMIEEPSGDIYIMDLEANNAPTLGNAPNSQLIELRDFLLACLQAGKRIDVSGAEKASKFSKVVVD